MAKEKYKELEDYFIFCTPRKIEQAINMLRGLLQGINLDNDVNQNEFDELIHWCKLQEPFQKQSPFKELIPLINEYIEENNSKNNIFEAIMSIVENCTEQKILYDTQTRGIQILHGIIYGILSDNIVTDNEIFNFNKWIKDNDFLKGTYPYDEIEALLAQILTDNIIDDTEREIFQAYISTFVDTTLSLNIDKPFYEKLQEKYHADGICALSPNVQIKDHVFCFTGASSKCTRTTIATIIEENGGLFNNGVTKKTEYLVVGDEGNPCWTFSCYGRKVEKAVDLRKKGFKLQIIHECDFWKAING